MPAERRLDLAVQRPPPSGRTARSASRDRARTDRQLRARRSVIPSKTSSTPETPPTISAAASRLLLEQRLILAVDLDVDRLRHAARQVADVVLEELAEVRVDAPAAIAAIFVAQSRR